MKVIVVTTSSKTYELFKDILSGPETKSIINVSSVQEAKLKLQQEHYDLVIVQTPASDEFGTRGAIEIARSFHAGVLLLVKESIYDQVLYQTRESDVLTIGIPCTSRTLYQSVQFCLIHRRYVDNLERELAKQKKKLQDEKLINRAKLHLIQTGLSEEEAHHLLEKRAMETSKSKTMVAKEIIEADY